MKIFFIGWNENGEKCLLKLLKNSLDVVQVVVPSGFDTKKMFEICKKYKVPVEENGDEIDRLRELIRNKKTDIIAVASFPKLFPKDLVDMPSLGTVNVHTAELPKYRGYHPLNWAIIRDEKTVGVTVHYMDEGMDTGDILAQESIEISNSDDINSIKDKLTTIGAQLLVKILKRMEKAGHRLEGIKQKESEVLFAPKRKEGDGRIKWSQNSRDVFNLVRALKSPYPNAFGKNEKGDKIEFEKSFLSKKYGEVLGKVKDYYIISVGDGVVLLKTKSKLRVGEILK